jgi:hypothetical protein
MVPDSEKFRHGLVSSSLLDYYPGGGAGYFQQEITLDVVPNIKRHQMYKFYLAISTQCFPSAFPTTVRMLIAFSIATSCPAP